MNDMLTKLMLEAFTKKQKPTTFLVNTAKKTVTTQTTVTLDSRTVKSFYSVNVQKGTGGRSVNMANFKNMEFETPEYNDYIPISPDELDKRQFGKTPFEASASMLELIVDRQSIISDMQRRSEEKQASDALFTGKITLIDGSTIDFNKQATHAITPQIKWNTDTGKPLDDIEAACQLCKVDGKVGSSTFNLIIADDSLNSLLNNQQFLDQAKAQFGIKRVDINMPENLTIGTAFHGQFSAGSFTINLFTYPQYYEIPTGYNFAGEGTALPYIPSKKALLLPTDIRFDMFYSGLYQVNNDMMTGNFEFNNAIEKVALEQLAYSYVEIDKGSASIIAGLKSRPLFIPTNVDGFCSFDAILS